jgi:hypothetical protein
MFYFFCQLQVDRTAFLFSDDIDDRCIVTVIPKLLYIVFLYRAKAILFLITDVRRFGLPVVQFYYFIHCRSVLREHFSLHTRRKSPRLAAIGLQIPSKPSR